MLREPLSGRPILAGSFPSPLGRDAYHGLAGDFVDLVAPQSEADPAAMLSQFLTGFGNIVGRARYFVAEETRHHARLFVGVVGETAVSRKGTSWGRARRPLAAIDPRWADRIASGISSGEGLIAHVRDPLGEISGVEDKRLLVVEPELASLLRVMARDGNTASPVIRRAWDGDVLSTLTRKDPLTATGAHVSLIGHITKAELEASLRTVEYFNGWGNRWLWICARRSKVLPEGGRMDERDLATFQAALREAVADAQMPGEVMRDAKARDLWHAEYERLTTPPPGPLGSILSRGDAYVMRLALIYSLLDQSAWISEVHLRAALEVWRYAADSAAFLFGERIGDPLAEKILRVLSERGGELPRASIVDAFNRHLKREDLDDARDALLDLGLISIRSEGTNGRAREVWTLRPRDVQSEGSAGADQRHDRRDRQADGRDRDHDAADPDDADPGSGLPLDDDPPAHSDADAPWGSEL